MHSQDEGLEVSQRSPEWFAQRAGKFTGSRFKDLMARTRSGPAAAHKNLIVTLAVERIMGTCAPTYQNAAMERGIALEPEAREAYENSELVAVEEVDFIQHPELDFVGVSPDGLVGDDGMVEIKCPSAWAKHYAALLGDGYAKEYMWQLQGQLWVAQREWVDFVSYHPDWPEQHQLGITRVERDQDKQDELEAACIAANEAVTEAAEQLERRAA